MDNSIPNNNSEEDIPLNVQAPATVKISIGRSFTPASFALVIICFFFTFCDFKCGGQKIETMKGNDFLTGKHIEGQQDSYGRSEETPSNNWAIVAFSSAIIGLFAFLLKGKWEAVIGTCAGIVGFASLLIFQFVIKSVIEEKGNGQIETVFQSGYWGALISMGVACLLSLLRVRLASQTGEYNFIQSLKSSLNFGEKE